MLYLLGVLWVATHYSRAAAILASVSVRGGVRSDFRAAVLHLRGVRSPVHRHVRGDAVDGAGDQHADASRPRAGRAARQRERRTAAMLELSQELSSARTTEAIAAATTRHVADVLAEHALLILPDKENRLVVRAASGGDATLDPKELGVAQWAFDHDQPAGRGTSTLPAAGGTYAADRRPRGIVGVIGILPGTSDGHWSGQRRQLVEAFASQAAVAIEPPTSQKKPGSRGSASKPSSCATRCSPACRTSCARRWRGSPAPSAP